MTERDPGLQPERTELAWRRTLLAIAAGALIGARLLPGSGAWPAAVAAVGVLLVAALWLVVRRRARRQSEVVSGGSDALLPGGGPLAVLAATVAGGAVLGLVLLGT